MVFQNIQDFSVTCSKLSKCLCARLQVNRDKNSHWLKKIQTIFSVLHHVLNYSVEVIKDTFKFLDFDHFLPIYF